MRIVVSWGIAVLAISALAMDASAGLVAKYSTDFTLSGPPKAGWSYQWNASGPIEAVANVLNTAALVNLVRDSSGNFETAANSAYPDPAPANFLAATPTSMFPGQ